MCRWKIGVSDFNGQSRLMNDIGSAFPRLLPWKLDSRSFRAYATLRYNDGEGFAQYSAGPLPEGLQWSHHSKDVSSAQLHWGTGVV